LTQIVENIATLVTNWIKLLPLKSILFQAVVFLVLWHVLMFLIKEQYNYSRIVQLKEKYDVAAFYEAQKGTMGVGRLVI
jgi:hypothetical protein